MTRIEQLEQRLKRLEQKVCCKTQFVDELPVEGNEGSLYVLPDGSVWVWDGLAFVSTSTTESYYFNSYIDRLKALGSPVQYSNYMGGTTGSVVLVNAKIILSSIYMPKTSTISNIGWRQVTQGSYTADEYNGLGIYSINTTTGDLTLLAKTANDGTIWSTISANGYGNKDLETNIILEKGIYFVAALYHSVAQTTAPTLATASFTQMPLLSTMNVFNLPTNTYLNASVTGQITLPNNIPYSSLGFTQAVSNEFLFYLS